MYTDLREKDRQNIANLEHEFEIGRTTIVSCTVGRYEVYRPVRNRLAVGFYLPRKRNPSRFGFIDIK